MPGGHVPIVGEGGGEGRGGRGLRTAGVIGSFHEPLADDIDHKFPARPGRGSGAVPLNPAWWNGMTRKAGQR